MAEEHVQRRLAAILAADVVGYSRLMGADEESTLHTLKVYREIIDRLIVRHEGRIFSIGGDSVLAEFGSAVEAVRCSVAIQEELGARNATLPEDRRMMFRIGINVGDVMVEDGNLFGDGVNVAARLEGVAEPGGICISGSAFDQVRNKLSIGFEDIGPQEVKNIAEPVPAFRVVADRGAVTKMAETPVAAVRWRMPVLAVAVAVILAAAAGVAWWRPWAPEVEPASIARMAFPLPEKPSIAVLPFTNMSGDKEQEFFSDGITEDIITDLSKVSGLYVAARNSTFTYKGKTVKAHQVAEGLGVRYVLEGSVQRSGDRLRINVQLIDAVKGSHVWAERYDRKPQDVFDIQDEIAGKVVAELAVTLKAHEQERIYRRHTNNLEAYETYLRAWRLRGPIRDTNLRAKRKKLLERIIALDPKFAGGYALLSFNYGMEVRQGQSTSPQADIERALALGKKAVATDDMFGPAHTALGFAYLMKHEHDKAIAAAQEAIRIQPNDADGYAVLAYFLHWAGRGEEAITAVKTAMRLNPKPTKRESYRYTSYLGMANFTAGRYDEAIEVITGNHYALRMQRGGNGICFLAAAYISTGQVEKARATIMAFLAKHPNTTLETYTHPRMYKQKEDLDRYLTLLRKAGMPERPPLRLPKKPSIAVLPFTNMSDDKRQEYFSDGITEDIITDLSKVSGLVVIARNSSFQYKGKSVDVRDVARDLGVGNVLEGSVRRAGDALRITAQLINGRTGSHIWAERYDRKAKDVFAIQDEIAEKVVAELAVTLKADEQERLLRKHTDSLAAYETYLRTRRMGGVIRDAGRRAERMKLAERVVALDPNFAGGYASISSWLGLRVRQGQSAAPQKDIERAFKLAEKAVAVDPTFAHAYAALGNAYLMKHEHDKAIAAAREAVRIQPGDANGYLRLGYFLHWSGRGEEAIEAVKTAMRLDPKPKGRRRFTYPSYLGLAYFTAGRYQDAIATLRKHYEFRVRVGSNGLNFLAAAYVAIGQIEKGRAAVRAFLAKKPGTTIANYRTPRLYKRKEDLNRYLNLLRQAGMPE